MGGDKLQDQEAGPSSQVPQKKNIRKRRCFIAGGALLFCILLLFIVILVLALTVFKVRDPRIQVKSVALEGFAPRISFPVINIQLNITLYTEILLVNRNHASFRHGQGKSMLFYNGTQVGEADLYPGLIPAMKSTTIASRLTLEAEKFASRMSSLIQDVLSGELVMDTTTRVPGKITFLRIIHKHAVTVSNCRIVVGIFDMKIRRQECTHEAKL